MFISSHSLAEVQRLCDRVAFIRDGRLVGVTTVDDLNRAASKQIRASADSKLITEIKHKSASLKSLKLVESQPTRLTFSYIGKIQPILRFFADYQLDDLIIQEPELEEVFMSYYEEKSAVKPGKSDDDVKSGESKAATAESNEDKSK